MNYEIKQLEDGTVAMWLTDAPQYVGWVSSWHLVEPKANQLKEAYASDIRTGLLDPGSFGESRKDE